MIPLAPQVRTPDESPWEHAAFVAYLAVIGLLPFRFGAVKIAGLIVTLTDGAFIGAFALWFGAWLFAGLKPRKTALFWPVLAYAGAMLVSIFGTAEPKRSIVKFVGELYLFGLLFLSVNLVTNRARLARVCQTWLLVTAATVIACVVGVVAFYLGVRDRSVNLVLWNYGSLPPGNYPRLYGFFANGNMLCNYLVVSAALTLAGQREALLSRRAATALLCLLGLTAIFTMSTGIGGVTITCGLWYFLETRGTSRGVLGRLALLAGLGTGLALTAASTVSLTGEPSHGSPRLLVWADAFRTFLAHPLVGKGVGTDPASISWVEPSGIQEHLTEAHNVLLSVAAQEGVFGVAALAWLVVCLLKLWRRSMSSPWTRALGCAFVGTFLYHGLTGAFEDARHIWIMIGLFVAAMEFRAQVGSDLVAHVEAPRGGASGQGPSPGCTEPALSTDTGANTL